MRPSFVLAEIGIALRRNITLTVAALLTITIALTLLGVGLMVNRQVSLTKGYWYDRIEVSVFLCGERPSAGCSAQVSAGERADIERELRASPQVERVYYESQQEAYQRFAESFERQPDLIRGISETALPESFRVKLGDPEDSAAIVQAFAGRPGVERVTDFRSLLGPFFRVVDTMQVYAIAAAVLALIAAVLLIAVTIRVAAFSRRRETGIMRLVGASSLSIQLPFLLEGILTGVVGAAFACGLLFLGQQVLVEDLRDTYAFTAWIDVRDVTVIAITLVVVAVVLSAAASVLSLRRYLRV